MAWMSCAGATPHDAEFMGRVTYVPKRGMPGYFFPYMNQGLLSKPHEIKKKLPAETINDSPMKLVFC